MFVFFFYFASFVLVVFFHCFFFFFFYLCNQNQFYFFFFLFFNFCFGIFFLFFFFFLFLLWSAHAVFVLFLLNFVVALKFEIRKQKNFWIIQFFWILFMQLHQRSFRWFYDKNNNSQFKQFENDWCFEFNHFCVIRIDADVEKCCWKFKFFKTLFCNSPEQISENQMKNNDFIHNWFWQFDCFLFVVSFFFLSFLAFSASRPPRVPPHPRRADGRRRRAKKKPSLCFFFWIGMLLDSAVSQVLLNEIHVFHVFFCVRCVHLLNEQFIVFCVYKNKTTACKDYIKNNRVCHFVHMLNFA